MGRIVALGEVVSDIYRAESSSRSSCPSSPGRAGRRRTSRWPPPGSARRRRSWERGGRPLRDFIVRALEDEGVDVSAVRRREPPTRTSIAFVEISDDGDRAFTFYRSSPAADEMLSPEDVARETVSGASFVNFGSIPLLREPSRGAVHRFAQLANELSVPVAFDVNLRDHLWESTAAAREAVDPLLDRSRIVKLGHEELRPLLETDDPAEAARLLLGRGASLVLVSLGADGAFYATDGFQGDVPAFPIEAVDATGAGDAFLAATLVRLADAGGRGGKRGWCERRPSGAARRAPWPAPLSGP
ncbi:hypothetical protein GBA65_05030 [Rubrobacter marinus]|uniref:Carbohydrate kinase PfkB domain-containing protein n=1 Tax=Rubrobacter marinus TaxID=2653852 RepID=A0A6G8PUY7_9ACTN|nr:hypothetical protein GBA65_05030 [Rubrobacter marinus]